TAGFQDLSLILGSISLFHLMHSYKVINVSIFSIYIEYGCYCCYRRSIITFTYLDNGDNLIILSVYSGWFHSLDNDTPCFRNIWRICSKFHILASIITVIFLQKVIGRLYDRLYCVIVHFPNDNEIRK
ncbi:MAG: hypothetical protein K0S67_1870, partial [Nitrososphaeraceae archaeon]|nr:hypothetical protein [Nitrososphaeraceae archaeon]